MRIASLRLHSSGQYMVKLGGKCSYLGTDRIVAERRYRETIVEFYGTAKALPALGGASGETVAGLLRAYVADRLRACAGQWKGTKEHVFKQATRHAVALYGELPAEDFGPKAYKTVRQAMAAEPGRSCGYVNMLCTRLKAAWKWGVSEELVTNGAYQRLLTVPDLLPGDLGLAGGREVLPVSQQLFEATLPYVSGTCGDFLRLLWLSGARPSELLKLTPAELVKDGAHWVYRPRSHKTARMNKLRAVVFGAESVQILSKYWPKGAQERFFACFGDVTVVRNAIYRACARAGLARWHPYQLRHAAVTRIALEHGKEVAQAVAGHARMATTENYDHGAVERAKRAAG